MDATFVLTTKSANNAKLNFTTLSTTNAGNVQISSGTASDVLFNKAARNVKTLLMSIKETASLAETSV